MEVNSKKKIFFFTSFLGGGGAEKHLVRLVNNFDYDKYEVYVITTRSGGSYEIELNKNAHLIALFNSFKSSTLALLFSVRKLKNLIKEIRPDYISSFMDRPNLVLGYIIKSLKYEIKTIFNCQVSPIQNYNDGSLISKVTLGLIPKYYPLASKIISLSEGVGQEISSLCNNRIQYEVIPNIAYIEYNAENETNDSTKDKFQIVACGRLVKQKGFEYLLKAMTNINYPCELKIFGTGSDEKKLKTLSESLGLRNVKFMGFENDLSKIYTGADLFVLSSLWEGFGNVIVEAMSYGVPVISTNCPHGPAEIITHEKNGYLIKVADTQALLDAINLLIDSEELRNELSANGSLRAKDFSGERIAAQYMKMLQSME